MLFIPRVLISLVTFPGVVIHEFAHEKMCERFKIPVHEVVYFRVGNPAGYVLHDEPQRFRQSFAVSGAPFLLNSVLAVLLTIPVPYMIELASPSSITGLVAVLLVWLSLSIGMHSLPSSGDAKTVWSRMVEEWRQSPTVLIAAPVIILVYILNLLRVFWSDAFYAMILAVFGYGIGSGVI